MDRNRPGPGAQVATKAIDDYMISKMKSFKIPGLALSVVRNDRIFYLKGYGKASVRGRPVTPQTPFNIASVYKSFVGLGISQLIDAGHIDIDEPVKTYLPWFTLADPEAAGQITVRHLLSHTSSLPKRSGIMVLYTNPVSLERLIRNLAKIRLSRPPGAEYQYSNLNYFILAEVIETVSGMPFGQYVDTHIFKPLDMRHSYTSQTEARRNGMATGYSVFSGLQIPFFRPENKAFIHLFLSSEGMAHYMVAQLNEGMYNGNPVISGQGMARTHTPLMPGTGSYGMGWAINDINIAHNGAMENFRSDVFLRSGEDGDKWGAAVLINSMDVISSDIGVTQVPYGNLAYDIIRLLHGQQPENDYSPPGITIPTILKTAIIIPLYLLSGVSFSISLFRKVTGKG